MIFVELREIKCQIFYVFYKICFTYAMLFNSVLLTVDVSCAAVVNKLFANSSM